MHDVVTLISETIETDALQQKYPVESQSETVLCDTVSIKRSEWFQAYQAGYDAEICLEVFHADYHGQRIAEFHEKRFVIYRYFQNGERTELYLGKRAGDSDE